MKALLDCLRPHLFFVVLFFLTLALIAGVAAKTQVGPHGGTLKGVENYFIEMKQVEAPSHAVTKKLYAYLLDKKMKTFTNKEVSADILFFFPDSTSTSIPLKPEMDDAFTCEVPADYHACKITFNLDGKLLSAKFNSPIKMVKNK